MYSKRFIGDLDLEAAVVNKTVLTKGCKGDGVAKAQQALIDLGYAMPLSTNGGQEQPDGIFGKETDGVVREFQQKSGLEADGDIGPQTLSALDQDIALHDLRPAILAVGDLSEAADASLRRNVGAPAMKSDLGRQLKLKVLDLKLTLDLSLPDRRKTEMEHFMLRSSRLSSDRFERYRNLPNFREANALTLGAIRPAHPAIMLLLALAAIATASRAKPDVRFPHMPLPAPDLSPWAKMLILAAMITKLTAQAIRADANKRRDAVKSCLAKSPSHGGACSAAVARFEAALGELLKCVTIAEHSGGGLRFPRFDARANKAQEEFDAAFKALMACLGCVV